MSSPLTRLRTLLTNFFSFRIVTINPPQKGKKKIKDKKTKRGDRPPLSRLLAKAAIDAFESARCEEHQSPLPLLEPADLNSTMHMALRIQIVQGLIFLSALCVIGTYFKPDVMAPFLTQLFSFLMLAMAFLFPSHSK
ncbi:MAG: hypothetical protein AAFQ74_19175 [Cyanobacteria bacterium J06623_4]